MNKYRIVGAIVLTALIALIYVAFSGEDDSSSPAPSVETEPAYSGLGK
jgi:hypothetical protein